MAAVPFAPCYLVNLRTSTEPTNNAHLIATLLLACYDCVSDHCFGLRSRHFLFFTGLGGGIRGRESGGKYIPVPVIPFPGGNKMAAKVLKICTLNYADSFPYKAWYVVNKASVLNKRSWHASLSINEIQYIVFKKMTRAALIIQSQYRTYREHERFKKSRRAAAIIQNSFRSYRERRRSSQRRREQRLSKRQEARYIQLASNRLVKWNATELSMHLTPNIFHYNTSLCWTCSKRIALFFWRNVDVL